MISAAVDANAIHAFQQERIADQAGPGQLAIERAFAEGCIALDDEGKCLHEWISAAGGAFPYALSDWVDNQLAMGTIKLFPMQKLNVFKKLQAVGLPKDDHKWVKLAISCNGNVIITNDIDFFEPSAKNASENKKAKLKESGGSCSKLLHKEFGITVKCMVRFANGLC